MNTDGMTGIVKNIAILLLYGALCAVGGYCYGLFDNGQTANEVREQLGAAQSNQQTITDRIGGATQAIEGAGNIIDECISILQQVRRQPAK